MKDLQYSAKCLENLLQNKMHYRRIALLTFVLFLLSGGGHNSAKLFCGEMQRPRTVNVLSTQYFDILFPQENQQTAMLLAKEADALYLNAKATFNCNCDFRTIVVISPDSDTLSVKYTASPYNRIVIFDSVGRLEESSYSKGLLDLFAHEVGRAVSQSVRSKAMDFVAKHFLGDAFQPISLLHIPYSFLEGAVYAEDEKSMSGILYDNWNLQLLMQAKLENKFPTLMRVSGAYDIHPVNKIDYIAAAAFYAYIQQLWGIEKFGKYWQECGKLNLFKLESKIFYDIYGVELTWAWNNFIEAIPVPEFTNVNEENTNQFLKTDYDSNYKFIVSTNYGLVWYDELKEEVDISGFYDYQSLKQLLFLANNITNLTVSPDGRFLVVSHVQGGVREKFEHDLVRIYDLKERKFLPEKYGMRDGSIVRLKDGRFAVAGNYVDDGYSCIRIYESPALNKLMGYEGEEVNLIYSRSFESDTTPYSPVALGKNYFACLLCRNNEWYIMVSDIVAGSPHDGMNDEDFYTLSVENQNEFIPEMLKLRNLRYADYVEVSGKKSDRDKNFCLLYDFVLQFNPSFVRTGWLFFDKDSVPTFSFVAGRDYYGGMSSGAMFNCKLYYSSQKFDYSEIRYVHLNDIPLADAQINYCAELFSDPSRASGTAVNSVVPEPVEGPQAEASTFTKYSPWKYMRKGSFSFFMPVRDITMEEGVKKEPGLGVTFETQSDPFSNNELLISAAKGFVPLDFEQIFNADKKKRDELTAQKIELSKDAAFAVYFKNTSTPADIIASGVFKFNEDGEYTLYTFADAVFSLPLAMTFRRLTFDVSFSFNASTTYWDITQTELFPNLSGWPSLGNSYRNSLISAGLQYSNIHQYGISPMKKIGLAAGAKISSAWEWGNWNPYQISTGFYGTGEIPYLMPVQNFKNMIFCLPTSVHAEIFYTNGKAVDAYAQLLVTGMEIQNGFWRLYFPRVALYTGYDIALEYDTVTVRLPDLRHPERFYDVFGSCYLNDSIYLKLDFGLTPVIGKFSKVQFQSSLRLEKYLRSEEWKLKFDIDIKY